MAMGGAGGESAMTARNITVTADLVRTMLGLADRGHLADLFATIMTGDVKTALDQFDVLYQAGADPVQTGQDLLAFCHLAARYKFVTLAEAELDQESRRARQIGQGLSVPVLTRAWQILLKGVAEIAASSDSRAALEMVLIRLGFVTDLPSPADLLRRHQDVPNMGGTQAVERAVERAAPQTAIAAAPSLSDTNEAQPPSPPPLNAPPLPANYDQIIALFAARGEKTIEVNLRRYCQVMEFAEGHIQLRAAPGLPKDFAAQLSRMLMQWTGRGWDVAVTEDAALSPPALPSHMQAASQAPQIRREPQISSVNAAQNDAMGLVSAAAAHPIIQAWLAAIPGAEIIRVTPLNDTQNPPIFADKDKVVDFHNLTSETGFGSQNDTVEPDYPLSDSDAPDFESQDVDRA